MTTRYAGSDDGLSWAWGDVVLGPAVHWLGSSRTAGQRQSSRNRTGPLPAITTPAPMRPRTGTNEPACYADPRTAAAAREHFGRGRGANRRTWATHTCATSPSWTLATGSAAPTSRPRRAGRIERDPNPAGQPRQRWLNSPRPESARQSSNDRPITSSGRPMSSREETQHLPSLPRQVSGGRTPPPAVQSRSERRLDLPPQPEAERTRRAPHPPGSCETSSAVRRPAATYGWTLSGLDFAAGYWSTPRKSHTAATVRSGSSTSCR